MSDRLQKTVLAALLLLGASHTAQAALQGRDVDGNLGNGFEAYYDTTLNITWLADANRAYSSGYSTAQFGEMTWRDTKSWIDGTVNASGGLYGVTDWRLPTTALANPPGYTWNHNAAEYYGGVSDYSLNRGVASNELGYMYYVNLGLLAKYNTSGAANGAYSLHSPGVLVSNEVKGGFYNEVQFADLMVAGGASFQHVSADAYWTGSTLENDPQVGSGEWALFLGTWDGGMDIMKTTATASSNLAAAWLVTNGDKFAVSAVPEPQAYALMLAGLGVVSWQARRARKARVAA